MNLLPELINPETKQKIDTEEINFFNEIPDLFLSDKSEITRTQSEFYDDIKFPNYDDIEDFGTLFDKSTKSIFIKKLDDEIPHRAEILEAGCGTGQLSIALSRFGRRIHGIDLSKGSLNEAKKFIDKINIKNVQFYRMNIFKLYFKKNFFDIVISNGVLHHTTDARVAFSELVKHLKPNGIIVIGLYHKYGRLMQNLRQKLIRIFGERFKNLDKRFSTNISEKKKYAWFRDQYQNPHETKHTFSEVIKWFDQNNIEYLNSIPFDFNFNNKLLLKQKPKSKYFMFLNELSLMANLAQINEGGFFVMIGKKKN